MFVISRVAQFVDEKGKILQGEQGAGRCKHEQLFIYAFQVSYFNTLRTRQNSSLLNCKKSVLALKMALCCSGNIPCTEPMLT